MGILQGLTRPFKLAALLALAIGVLAAQPAVTNVENAATNLAQGLPNGSIAEGSIFVVIGSGMGPSPLVTAPNPFQSTNLSGTSVSVTVSGQTVNALMYYTSATQVAALLPSGTPAGSGTITVTYNGSASATLAVTVVQNNVGIFTVAENGQGVAIATFPDYSLVSAVPGTGSLADTCSPGGACPYTYGGAVHPGDTVTLWATGLGPVSADNASTLGQTPQGLSSLALWLGGVSVPLTYAGRSGCCVGEDQIVFVVPNNAPTGCAVPLILQINSTTVSNSTVMPIASSGRTCTPQNPALSNAAVQALTTGSAPINYAYLQMGRQIGSVTSNGIDYEDYGLGWLGQVSVAVHGQTTQPTVLSSLDNLAFGTCIASPLTVNANSQTQTLGIGSAGNPALLTPVTGVDAGSISLSGPFPDVTLTMTDKGGTPTLYSDIFSPTGVYFSGGAYTIRASGGRDVSSFSTSFTIVGPSPTWTGGDQNRLITAGVSRAGGMVLNWTPTPGAAVTDYAVEISGSSYTDNTGQTGAGFSCIVPDSAGTFTVPSSVLLALPSGPYGEVDFKPILPSIPFSASGLNFGILNFQYETSVFLTYN